MTAPASGNSSGDVLILGGSGRLGTLLRRAWAGSAGRHWQARQPAPWAHEVFSPLEDPAALARAARGRQVIFCLAGRVSGADADLAENAALASAAVRAGAAAGVARVFLVSSAAVYGRAEAGTAEPVQLQPVSAYGRAKQRMEEEALALSRALGQPATVLRIGNVAGADQLLGPGAAAAGQPRLLDTFAPDWRAPVRSYIGPRRLAEVLDGLFSRADGDLPGILNVSAAAAVGMDALLEAAGIAWTPRPAPAGAIARVVLDVTRLAGLLPAALLAGDASSIVADWRGLVAEPLP